MENKPDKRGGKRENSGRKKIAGKLVTFKVKPELIKEFKQAANIWLSDHKNNE